MIADGHTEAHHVVPRHPNASTFRIESADDIDHAIWLFQLSYLVRLATLEAHGEMDSDLDVQTELDTLAPSDAIRRAFEAAVAA